MTKIINIVALGLINKFLGGLFGIAKVFIVICVFVLLLDVIDSKYGIISEKTKTKSMFYEPLLEFSHGIYNKIRF